MKAISTIAVCLSLYATHFSIAACPDCDAAESDSEQAVEMKQMPAEAAKAILLNLESGRLVKIEKETDNGQEAYEVIIEADGKSREVKVAADGKILGAEGEISLKDLPGPARKTLERQAAGGKIKKLTRENENGQTTYEALIRRDGAREEVEVDENGRVLSLEKKEGRGKRKEGDRE